MVPPCDMKGSGTPTAGNNPITIAMLIKTCNENILVTPTVSSLLNVLRALVAIDNEIYISNPHKIIKSIVPQKPNSSASNAKIKSV